MEWKKCFDGGNLLVEEQLILPIKLQLYKADIQSKVNHDITDWLFNWLNIIHVIVMTFSVKFRCFNIYSAQHTFSTCIDAEFSSSIIFSLIIMSMPNADTSTILLSTYCLTPTQVLVVLGGLVI